MSPRILDISPPITEKIGVWPGDSPFRREVLLDMAGGDNLTLSTIHTTVHLGAHTDGPNHYVKDGSGIGTRDLSFYYGPCQIVAVDVEPNARIKPDDVRTRLTQPRLLFKTGSFPDPNQFNEDFNSLSPELVALAYEQGVRLIGLDTPSVDPFHDKILESHNAIASRDMAILEGVDLRAVEPGLYTLIALPLPLLGCDASPVRAVLIADD